MNARCILLVEDDPGDQKLIQLALSDLANQADVVLAQDGQEALDYLRQAPPFENVTRPDLILADINMPQMSGIELLEEVRNDPRLRSIPVIMLTTSNSDEDVQRCYDRGCNAYLVKPFGHQELKARLTKMCGFWLEVARLPRIQRFLMG